MRPQISTPESVIADLLLIAAAAIDLSIALGHPVWGDGRALDRGWPAMLAWNLALAGLCAAARHLGGAP